MAYINGSLPGLYRSRKGTFDVRLPYDRLSIFPFLISYRLSYCSKVMISNDAYQGLNSVTVPTNVTACSGSTPVRSPISGEMSFEESQTQKIR